MTIGGMLGAVSFQIGPNFLEQILYISIGRSRILVPGYLPELSKLSSQKQEHLNLINLSHQLVGDIPKRFQILGRTNDWESVQKASPPSILLLRPKKPRSG